MEQVYFIKSSVWNSSKGLRNDKKEPLGGFEDKILVPPMLITPPVYKFGT